MARGGKRVGAGRKVGSQVKRTQEIIAKAAAEGISPLEVLLTSMRMAWESKDADKACAWAEKAAPYVHPRLAAVEHSGDKENPLTFTVLSGVTRDETETKANGHASH